MGTINISVAHDDDASVAQFGHIEMLANANANSRDDILYFLVGKHLFETGALNVQDFPS
jgi:hypothetical protein